METWKRIVLWVAVAALVLSLAVCQKKTEQAKTSGESKAEEISSTPEETKPMEEAEEEIEEATDAAKEVPDAAKEAVAAEAKEAAAEAKGELAAAEEEVAAAEEKPEMKEQPKAAEAAPAKPAAEITPDNAAAIIEMAKGGRIVLEFYPKDAPNTVDNFIKLTKKGFYDGLKFHRVIANFMIQGGCPLGTGTGGPGYKFEDECKPELKHDRPGILSMANAGPGTNGSQFFITHVPTPHLNGKHTVFGAVVGAEDQKVVNAIAKCDKIVKMVVTGDTGPLFKKVADRITEWNKVIEAKKK